MHTNRVENINILVVDDDESLRGILNEVLTEDGYSVTVASSGEEALAVVRLQQYDIVVLDVRLPGMSGLEVLKRIKEIYPHMQVIIITSHASLETAVVALRSGAYDYLSKPFDDIDIISAVVGRAAEKIRLTRENTNLVTDLIRSKEELEEANKALTDLAIRDGLTGLYNHRYFHEVLTMELERSTRHPREFCLIFIDVDYFKNYNDTHGHLEGDHILASLSKLLIARFRKVDVVARYGGEEFIVLLPETSRSMALQLAEEIRNHIEEHPFHGREEQPFKRLTVSMGVAAFPEDGMTGPLLITNADNALYRAKAEGRNRVCAARPASDT